MLIGEVADGPIHIGLMGRNMWIFKEGSIKTFIASSSNGHDSNAKYSKAQGPFLPCPPQRSLLPVQSSSSGLVGWDNLPFLI